MVLPCYAGPFEGRVDYQAIALWRIVRQGNAGKKLINQGADGLLGLTKPGFVTDPELRTSTYHQLEYFYIHAVKCICQGTNAHFVICPIFTLLPYLDRLGCNRGKA